MELKLHRIYKDDKHTIGKLYIDDVYFSDTIEDVDRIVSGDCSMKIQDLTAIPTGRYTITMEWWEKHNNYYPYLHDVPCFTGILIHAGIDETSSSGCIILSRNGLARMEELRTKLTDVENITIEIW